MTGEQALWVLAMIPALYVGTYLLASMVQLPRALRRIRQFERAYMARKDQE